MKSLVSLLNSLFSNFIRCVLKSCTNARAVTPPAACVCGCVCVSEGGGAYPTCTYALVNIPCNWPLCPVRESRTDYSYPLSFIDPEWYRITPQESGLFQPSPPVSGSGDLGEQFNPDCILPDSPSPRRTDRRSKNRQLVRS